jgi:hypothetical protein
MAHWGVARAGWVAPITTDALQSRVKEKSTRLPEYRNTVKENWLVIVDDRTKPSQMFEAQPDFDARGISRPFSRTYFYGHREKTVIELGCAPAAQPPLRYVAGMSDGWWLTLSGNSEPLVAISGHKSRTP